MIFAQISLTHCFAVQWTEGKPVPSFTLVDDDDVMEPVILPDKSDMFVAYATVPGYRSVESGITEFVTGCQGEGRSKEG